MQSCMISSSFSAKFQWTTCHIFVFPLTFLVMRSFYLDFTLPLFFVRDVNQPLNSGNLRNKSILFHIHLFEWFTTQ